MVARESIGLSFWSQEDAVSLHWCMVLSRRTSRCRCEAFISRLLPSDRTPFVYSPVFIVRSGPNDNRGPEDLADGRMLKVEVGTGQE